MGPNSAPIALTALSLIEENPYWRCTPNSAVSMIAASGRVSRVTNAPAMTLIPPRNSSSEVTHAMRCGWGTPSDARMVANESGPRLSLA